MESDDLKKLDLDYERLNYDEDSTRKVFWEIMALARERTGFDAANTKLLVEAFPDRRGGFSLYVTKISEDEYIAELYVASHTKKNERADRRAIYAFDDFENLLAVCGVYAAQFAPLKLASRLAVDRGTYYLMLSVPCGAVTQKSGEAMLRAFYAFLGECGERVAEPNKTTPWLEEHAAVVIDARALELLSEKFVLN